MNREGWLTEAMRALRPLLKRQGLSVPKGTRISCSWPTDHGTSRKVRKDAETWFFKNGAPEIAISPTLGQDDVEVLGTLAHEMVHAAIGGDFDHRHKEFCRAARSIGLTGKMSSTTIGPELRVKLAKISKRLGPYPHVGVKV